MWCLLSDSCKTAFAQEVKSGEKTGYPATNTRFGAVTKVGHGGQVSWEVPTCAAPSPGDKVWSSTTQASWPLHPQEP